MPKRLYYIVNAQGRRIDGADRLCDINTLLKYHGRRNPQETLRVTLYDNYEVRA